MRLLIALALAVSAFGAITTSPATIAQSMRGALAAYPRHATIDPGKRTITVSGTGAWTVIVGGDLSTICNYGAGCITPSPASGTDAGTITLTWSGTNGLSVGAHTGTVTVAGNVTTITLTVVAPKAYATFAYRAGYPVGCANSDTIFNFDDTCTVADYRPPSEAFTVPAPGGSYTDSEFGHVTTTIATAHQVYYSTLTAFNADNTLVMTTDAGGNLDIYNRSGTEVYANKDPGDTALTAWDAVNPNVYWRREANNQIWKYDLSTSTDTKAADYGGTYTSISNGGTGGISADNWWVFWAPTDSVMCAVDLTGLTVANQASHTYCASYAALPRAAEGGSFDYAYVSEVDATAGKRYVVGAHSVAAAVWSVNTSTGVLDWENYLGELAEVAGNNDNGVCETGETCLTTPHAALGRDTAGNVVLLYPYEGIITYSWYIATIQLNRGTARMRPVEEGGGWRILFSQNGDYGTPGPNYTHFGCAGANCVFSASTGYQIPVRTITAASQENPAKITVSAAHPWVNADKVIIEQVTGNACVNGIRTITKVDSTSFTLDGVDCTGAGAYAGGGLAGSGNTVDSPIRGENIAIRLAGDNSVAYRINSHRSVMFDTNSAGYYNTPRTSISRDGAFIAYASNMGTLGAASVFVAETGLSTTGLIGTSLSGTIEVTGFVSIK